MNRDAAGIIRETQFVRSPGYAFLEDDGGLFFLHESGRRVRTDALGREIWNRLPGEREDVLRRVREILAVPEMMARDFLEILVTSGIAAKSAALAPDPDHGKSHGAATRSSGGARAPASGDPGPAFPGGVPVEGSLPVSVVVSVRPGRSDLRACLVSLRRQIGIGFEIIVVASGRDADATIDIAARESLKIRLVAVPDRLSRSARINRGVRAARGEFLLILDAAAEVHPDCLFNLKSRLDADPVAAAAAPVVRFSDLRAFVKSVGKHMKGKDWKNDNYSGAVDLGGFAAAGDLPAADFNAVLIRRSAWADVGPADETLPDECGDLEWSFRARLLGRRIVPAGAAVVHLAAGTPKAEEPRLRRNIVAGRLGIVIKLFRGKTLRDFLISFFKEDAKAFLSRGLPDYPTAYASLCLALPGILGRRMGIMRRRDRGCDEDFLPGPKAGFPVLTGDDEAPRVDADAYFRHYFWEFERIRKAGGRESAV